MTRPIGGREVEAAAQEATRTRSAYSFKATNPPRCTGTTKDGGACTQPAGKNGRCRWHPKTKGGRNDQ